MLDEAAVLQLGVGVPQLRLRVHHDRPGPSHRFLERPSGDEQKPDSGFARLHGDLVPRVEQHERAIAGVLTHRRPRRPRPLPHALGQHTARCRGVEDRAASLEHVGERVARGVHGQRLLHPRRDPYGQVPRVGRDALDGTGRAAEVADRHPYARPVVGHDFRDVFRQDVLVARIGHLERARKVRPQLKPVHPAALVALGHLLVQDAGARSHPLHVPGAERAAVTQAVAVLHRAAQDVGDGFDAPMGVPGIALLAIVLWDAFETIILPRRVAGRFRLTKFFYRTTWRPWRSIAPLLPRRTGDAFLSFYGPLSLLLLLALWASGIVFAFGMLQWASGSALTMAGGGPRVGAGLYMSGTTFFPLRLGGVVAPAALAPNG